MSIFRHGSRTAIAPACAAVVSAADGGCATAGGDDGSFRTISPIFGQLVVVNLPKGFVPASEKVKEDFDIREAVAKGKSVQTWRQMITLTGAKGLATKPGATPGPSVRSKTAWRGRYFRPRRTANPGVSLIQGGKA